MPISPLGLASVIVNTQLARDKRDAAAGPTNVHNLASGATPQSSTLAAALSVLDVLGIGAAAHSGMKAYAEGDRLGMSQSFLEFSKGSFVDVPRYALTGAQKSVQLTQLLPESLAHYLPAADPKLITFLQSATVTNVLGAFGAVTSFLGSLAEIHNLIRQDRVDNCLQAKENLVQTLTNLRDNLKPDEFFRSLPEYLKEKIGTDGADMCRHLNGLIEEVTKYDTTEEAKTFINRVQTGVIRQKVVHVLCLVSCIIGLAASIALLVGCPFVALAVLTAVGLCFTASAFVLKKTWVEHDGAGFHFRLLLPAALRSTTDSDGVELNRLSSVTGKTDIYLDDDEDEEDDIGLFATQNRELGFFEKVTGYLAGFAQFFTG